jgi:hypothetical protein
LFYFKKIKTKSQWYTPVVPVTQETEAGGLTVPIQPRQHSETKKKKEEEKKKKKREGEKEGRKWRVEGGREEGRKAIEDSNRM